MLDTLGLHRALRGSVYPPQTVQRAFRLIAESLGASLHGISEAGIANGRQFTLNWCERSRRWFVLAYEFDVGSWEFASIIGPDAFQPN